MGPVDSVVMAELFMDNEYLMPLVIEDCNLDVRMDYMGQRVSGGPLNDRLYRFLQEKERLDNEYMELSYQEMRMMMEGIAPAKIREELQPKAKKLSARIERLETKFIMDNYDNVLGPGVFMLLCNQYHYPILTDQIRAIMKKAPEKFRNHPYVKQYISTAEENMVRLQHITP